VCLSLSLSHSLSLPLSLSLTGEEGVRTLFTDQRERERVAESAGVLSVPHSVSQSACVIIILICTYIVDMCGLICICGVGRGGFVEHLGLT
jgi:hypothetical protein